MIYVRMELWPRGNRAKARVVGEATIANVGGTIEVGEYEAALLKWKADETAHEDPVKAPFWKRVNVGEHRRLTRGPWDLLFRVLSAAAGGSRNKGVEPWDGEKPALDERATEGEA